MRKIPTWLHLRVARCATLACEGTHGAGGQWSVRAAAAVPRERGCESWLGLGRRAKKEPAQSIAD